MGSDRQGWVSYENAVKKSGYTSEQVDDFINSHLVRSLDTDGNRLVSLSDLFELHESRPAPPLSAESFRREMLLVHEKVRRLEQAVNLLYEINGLSSYHLERLEGNALIELVANVDALLELPDWPLPKLLSCAEVYLKLSEVEIQRIEEATGRVNGWKPFLELCLRQLRRVTEMKPVDTDYEWSRCQALLSRGRDNLRHIAFTLCSLSRDFSPLHNLAKLLASHELDTFDKIIIYNRGKKPELSEKK